MQEDEVIKKGENILLYLSSKKFENNVEILKQWIRAHGKKILLIFNALDAKGEDYERTKFDKNQH